MMCKCNVKRTAKLRWRHHLYVICGNVIRIANLRWRHHVYVICDRLYLRIPSDATAPTNYWTNNNKAEQ